MQRLSPILRSRTASIGAALIVGPLFAYLAWALLNRRPVHTAAAVALNAAFWVAAPAFIAHFTGAL